MARRWVVALVAVVVGAAVLYATSLDAPANYDEGVYLASLDALTHGQSLGTDIYASQPPGFYVLLQGLSLLPGDGVGAIRAAFLLLALAGLGAAFAIGYRIAGGWGGATAAGLLTVTAPYPVQAARVQADTAAVAVSLCAVAVLMAAGRRLWLYALAGALAGAAVSIKLLALPVVAPVAVLLVAHRSWRAAGALAAGAAAVWTALLIAYAGVINDLWRSVVTDHADARQLGPTLGENLDRVLLHPLDWATPAGVIVPVGLVCAALFVRRVEMLALATWIVATAAFLVTQRPLLDHHIVMLAAVLAVTAGTGLGAALARLSSPARLAVAGVAVLAILAGLVQEGRRLDRLGNEEPADVRRAADRLRARTRPGDLVATDLPIVAYLADRRTPGYLVDTSFVRFGTGSLTNADIIKTLEHDHVRAVAVGRLFAERPQLMRELEGRYPRAVSGGTITLFLAP
jgi:hypothetical protein